MTKKTTAYWGRKAEEAAARKYNLDRVGNTWYDAVHKNGSKVQVKATRRKLSSGRKGRFKLWKKDHDLLKRNRGSYVFVLYHPFSARSIEKVQKVSTGQVDKVATWGPSGHKHKGIHSKITWDRLL